MEGRLARNGRMGEGDRRGRQRLMSIVGGWEVTRQVGERGRCHEEAALTHTRLGAQQSLILRLHGLQPLHHSVQKGSDTIAASTSTFPTPMNSIPPLSITFGLVRRPHCPNWPSSTSCSHRSLPIPYSLLTIKT